MDKRDNYFETRIRAARAQINQRKGSFSLPHHAGFGTQSRRLAARPGWEMRELQGCSATKMCRGKMPTATRTSTASPLHRDFPVRPRVPSYGTAFQLHQKAFVDCCKGGVGARWGFVVAARLNGLVVTLGGHREVGTHGPELCPQGYKMSLE